MARYAAKRLMSSLGILFILTIVVYSLVRLIPGDPVISRLGINADRPELVHQMRAQLGLDQPWLSQYFHWMSGVLRGNFGLSISDGQKVSSELSQSAPVSIELAIYSLVLAIAWGIPVGIISGLKKGRVFDVASRLWSFVAMSMPAFVAGTFVVALVSTQLRSWPILSYVSLTHSPLKNLQAMLLPALTLALPVGAVLARYSRAALLDVLGQDFLRTARSKGVGRVRLVTHHALRNALVPVVTIGGIQLAALVGGAVIVEEVFSLPGLGTLIVRAMGQNDYPVVQAVILVLGTIFVAMNLAVDLLYPLIDPRIRRA